MKKMLAVTLVVLMAGIVAGCGTKTESSAAAETEMAVVESEVFDTGQAQGSQESSASGDPVRIGPTTALTGDRSSEGEHASNAAKIIAEEINTQKGVLGRPTEIMIEDALGTDVGAINAYRKLVSDGSVVAIVGLDGSNDGMAQSLGVLKFKMSATVQGSSPTLKNMCNNDNPYLFQPRARDDILCAALIKYSVEELGIRSYVVMHDVETSSADQARLFTETLKSYGIEPVVTVLLTTGTKDFSSHIAQVQASGADATTGAAFQAEVVTLIQRIRSLGIETPILGPSGFADLAIVQLAGELNNNIYCASAWVSNTPNLKGAVLAEEYKELYGDDYGKAVTQIYDHISVICETITLASSMDRETAKETMNTIDDYQGAITKYDYRTNGDCGRGRLLVKVVKDEAEITSKITSEKVIEQTRYEQRERNEYCGGEELGT